jgi:pyrrolysine biosynthesis protein PylC
MKVVIVGGRLQGVEACYLALALGWKAVVVDSDATAPARGLGTPFFQIDVMRNPKAFREVVRDTNLIVPALEDVAALKSLVVLARDAGVPLAHHPRSYFISRSKKRSNSLMGRLGIPLPASWPECGFPVIAKPSTASGSQGVAKLSTPREMRDFFGGAQFPPPGWIVQEFLDGPSYSLEVFGCKGRYVTAQITELEMDRRFDCQRVLAPANITSPLAAQMEALSLKIARGLGLQGIMDVEVIAHQGILKVLEMDARLPSQTPSAVLHSIGVNMLVYEHLRVSKGRVAFQGEHVMSMAGPLRRIEGFFGADVALTDFQEGYLPWVATLIATGKDRAAAWEKRCQVVERIKSFAHQGGFLALGRGKAKRAEVRI